MRCHHQFQFKVLSELETQCPTLLMILFHLFTISQALRLCNPLYRGIMHSLVASDIILHQAGGGRDWELYSSGQSRTVDIIRMNRCLRHESVVVILGQLS
ncbi:hypothetical protein CDAR_593561 [Caerostris darwini]|uniref:Uncharacterized protein n=1 Tax=Caerostris darwini TaxID=1538125 RepID=A0AAV4S0X6_9ARAC|nr:hypothetical protein CDAR_593561 [Caerostris darwini]